MSTAVVSSTKWALMASEFELARRASLSEESVGAAFTSLWAQQHMAQGCSSCCDSTLSQLSEPMQRHFMLWLHVRVDKSKVQRHHE